MAARVPSAQVLLALVAALPAAGLEWPLEKPELAATFGSPAPGMLLPGLAIAAPPGSTVRSAAPGELVFAQGRESGAASAMPRPLGEFLAVEHPGGMIGLYAELAPGTASTHLLEPEAGEVLGRTGTAGRISGDGFLFALYDRAAARWVNPLVLLPPLADARAPLIRSAALRSGARTWVLGESRSVPQGSYAIAADLVDPGAVPWSQGPAAPYYARLVVDGELQAELTWDVAWAGKGGLSLFPRTPRILADQAGPDGRILLATRLFRRGRSSIEILVRDQAGNERRASWIVNVE